MYRILLFLTALMLPLLPFFWLVTRLTARRCPACGSKWRTEQLDEWGDELWICHGCRHTWHYPFPESTHETPSHAGPPLP